MIRASHIAVKLYSRVPGPESNYLFSVPLTSLRACILYSVLLILSLAGCAEPKEEPIWENVKIGDLAPKDGGKMPQIQLLKTINLDVHIVEIPAENIDKIDRIRKRLYIRPLRLTNYRAFTANSFLVRSGQMEMWNEIYEMLIAAEGQRITKVSLMLPDGQDETIAITGLDGPRTIFYTSINDSKEGANVGPGIFGLRIKVGKIPGSKDVCDVIAYPVFTLPITSTMPQIESRVKLREFNFTAAAFGLRMRPGDFVFLGPKEYISDQTALGGLFFSKPQDGLFFNQTEHKPPERKPSVRIFLLVCTGINY